MTLASEDASRIDGAPPPSASALRPGRRPLIAVAGFFAFKALIGFLILALSAKKLSVSSFATFSQLFLYLALLGSVAAAGVQNGVIREVAAAHGEERIERVFVLGGLAIWACFTGLVVGIAILLREPIAVLLVEDKGYGGTVVVLTVVALLAGLGTLLCSALSGSGRAPLSLMIQGLGVAIGGALCLLRLHAGDATGAVLCYAAGPLATSLVALWTSRHWLSMRNVTGHDILRVARGLLGYSGTFLIVASALPFVLFGVRYVYRLEFGPVWLGYWLMANRVSDVTTQVIGLYLSQVFLPQATRSPPGPPRLHVIRQTMALGVVVAGIGAGVFALASSYIIPLALSDRYLAASPFILGYLVGDMFRVGGNVALFTALAARRLPLFMAIEVILALLVGAAILAGIAFGHPAAAYWGYACAHATAFVIVLTLTRRLSVL